MIEQVKEQSTWKSEKITLATTKNYKGKSPCVKEAECFGNLCIHKSIGGAGWVVTQKPTGGSLHNYSYPAPEEKVLFDEWMAGLKEAVQEVYALCDWSKGEFSKAQIYPFKGITKSELGKKINFIFAKHCIDY